MSDLIFSKIDIYSKYSSHDKVQIEKALICAKKSHFDQKRSSGESYIIHPIAVAKIAIELYSISEIIIAALLHDVIEDTSECFNDIYHDFGFSVARIVNSVSKSHKIQIIEHGTDEERKMLHHYFLETIRDPRAAMVKVCDRLHNIRTLEYVDEEKQRRISSQTVKMYVPLAYEMGFTEIAKEFDISASHFLSKKEFDESKKISEKYDKEIKEKGYHKNAIEYCLMEF